MKIVRLHGLAGLQSLAQRKRKRNAFERERERGGFGQSHYVVRERRDEQDGGVHFALQMLMLGYLVPSFSYCFRQ